MPNKCDQLTCIKDSTGTARMTQRIACTSILFTSELCNGCLAKLRAKIKTPAYKKYIVDIVWQHHEAKSQYDEEKNRA